MTEETRKRLNEERLLKIDASIRTQVRAVLATLEYYGHKPLIDGDVWRDPKVQLALFRRGVSKLTWGFHCATTKQGRPASLAADIVDANRRWEASQAFWLCLGYAAKAQGLGWGGYWGLPANVRKGLDTALETVKTKEPLPSMRVQFGWDRAHVETRRVTVAEARAGKR